MRPRNNDVDYAASEFSSPEQLVSYFGLILGSGNPATSRPITAASPTGPSPRAIDARSKRRGSSLVHQAPLRAFFIHIRDKRANMSLRWQPARKLAVIIWHILSKDEDYT